MLPPEWDPQSGVMLTWPHQGQDSVWADSLAVVDSVYTTIVQQIALREQVLITYLDATHREHIFNLLTHARVNQANIKLYQAASDDIWVRDYGPITVIRDQQPHLLKFIFNGWGNKYPSANDNEIIPKLYVNGAFADISLQSINVVLEGGSIEVDGHGTLLTTRNCLLAPTRNPLLDEAELETLLCQWLGCKRVLWLDHGGLAGDDTDGHIDTLARFTDPHTIAYVACTDPKDEHYAELKAMEAELQSFVDYQGKPYKLVPLPWTQPKFADFDGRRLPATYANFLIINEAVLVPTYDDPADDEALTIIADCFPDRQIVGIPSLPIVQWYGSLHCMTMQLPLGALS